MDVGQRLGGKAAAPSDTSDNLRGKRKKTRVHGFLLRGPVTAEQVKAGLPELAKQADTAHP